MTARKCALGEIRPVTGNDGATFVAVIGSRQTLALPPAAAREAAEALTAAAGEAEAIDAAAAAQPVQDGLWVDAA